MDIKQNWLWIKFIPVIGIIFCVIDSSHDGRYWEKAYIYYHVVIGAIISQFI
jgi:hypothetical protein